MESNNQFWQFSDQLRLQSSNLANLSLNDSIWSVNPYGSVKNPENRRNFDIRVGGDLVDNSNNYIKSDKVNSDFNSVNANDGWKANSGINLNGGFNKGIYSKPSVSNYNNYNSQFDVGVKGNKSIGLKGVDEQRSIGKLGKKNKEIRKENNNINSKENNGENNKSGGGGGGVDKRFKTLPPSEALPRNETVGGYIFVCNNDTMDENLKRQLFGLPPRYRDSVRQITPGLPLFLYNYSTHQLHGIYQAASFGGTNIDPSAWEDKKNPGESRFPAQVRVQTRKLCEPLDEDAFRPILHHYDGPKFRLELSVPEALSLLDIFVENDG